MNVLTNDYLGFEMVNLGTNPGGRGPFSIRQDGVPPGSDSPQVDRYFLRKDGTWILNFRVFDLDEESQQDFLYDSIKEVQQTLNNLSGKVQCEWGMPEGKTKEELLQAMEATRSRLVKKMQEAKGTKGPLPSS